MATKVVRDPHLEFEWQAFIELSNDRQMGMSLGPLSWTSMHLYAERHGLFGDEFDRFARLIREMDSAYLGWHGRRMDEAKKP